MPAFFRARQPLGASRQIECFSVPMKKRRRGPDATEDWIFSARIGQMHRLPSDFESGVSVNPRSESLRDQLKTETPTEHGNTAAQTLFDNFQLFPKPRQRIVRRHRPAQNDDPRVIFQRHMTLHMTI